MRRWFAVLVLCYFILGLFCNIVSASWEDETFGGRVNVNNPSAPQWRSSSFGGSVEVESYTWSNWSEWWVMNNIYGQPDPPYNGTGYYSYSGHWINITWNRGNGSDYDLVIRKSGSYPTTYNDGTMVDINVNNQTSELYYFNASSIYIMYYYSIFSHNTTNGTYSDGLDITFSGGGLGLNCFNESNPNQAIEFDILISNSDGSQTYEASDLNNTRWLNLADIPYGDDTIFVVSNSSYKQRTYYYDIELGGIYNLTFYLPPIETPVEEGSGDDGGNTTTTRLYIVRVIDENFNPLEDVDIDIKRYMNATDEYATISTLITDANGEAEVYLIPNTLYKVYLSKTGYDSETEDYVTDPVYYGIYYPKTFMLRSTVEGHDILTFADIITFNATIDSGGNITVWYDDANENTTDTAILIYEYYNGSMVLNHTDERTGEDSFDFTDTGYNTSRTHAIVLYLNHSELGFEVVWIYVYPLYSPVSEDTLEAYFSDVFGSFELGWVKTFLVLLPALIPIIVFSPRHVGLGIIGAGCWMGFVPIFIDVSSVVQYATLAGIIIVMGMALVVIKKGRRAT